MNPPTEAEIQEVLNELRNEIKLWDAQWPEDVPFPVLWKRHLCSKVLELFHRGDSADDAVMAWREFYISQDLGFNPGDLIEIVLNHTLLKNNVPIYKFSAELIEALRITSLKSVPSDLVRTPFDVIYLDFSEKAPEVLYENKPSFVRGNVIRMDMLPTHRNLVLYQTRYVPNGLSYDGKPYPIAYNAMSLPLIDGETLDIPDGKELNELAMEMVEHNKKHEKNGLFTEVQHYGERNDDRDGLSDATRLAVNAILYITSVNSEIRDEWVDRKTYKKWKAAGGGKGKRQLRRNLIDGGRMQYCGSKLKLPSMPSGSSGGTDSGRKVGVRFKCAGHFRYYWFGPRDKETRKPIRDKCKREHRWIAPHWKGPEMADVVHEKVYRVDTKPEKKKDGD